MDEQALARLRDLYGLSPDAPHLALQFPRLPPGLPGRGLLGPPGRMPPRMAGPPGPRLGDFADSYLGAAAGMAEPGSARPAPPGHPLFAGQRDASLRAENDRLRRENADLRRKLGDGRPAAPRPPGASP